MLLRITSGYFVAGIECHSAAGHYDYDDEPVPIHRTASILGYMRGWTIHRIIRYCERKGWQIEKV